MDRCTIIIGHTEPFRIVQSSHDDTWNFDIDKDGIFGYDHIKLNRISGSFDIAPPDPIRMHIGFDGSFILPDSPDFQPIHAKARILFNHLACEFLLGGVIFSSIKPNDIGSGILYPTGYFRDLSRFRSISSSTWQLLKNKMGNSLINSRLIDPPSVFYEKLNKARTSGSRILDLFPDLMPNFIIDGTTYYRNMDYANSMVNFWVGVEQIVNSLWDTKIVNADNGLVSGRKNYLKNCINWTVSNKIETLFLAGHITEDLYTWLTKARKSRNTIMHKGAHSTKEDCQSVIQAFCSLVRREGELASDDTVIDGIERFYDIFESTNPPPVFDISQKPQNTSAKESASFGPLPPIPGEDEWEGNYNLTFNKQNNKNP